MTYVVLDSRDILIAENLGAESYMDVGNRAFFQEGNVTAINAAPDVGIDDRAQTHADVCRSFHINGPLLNVVRDQLQRRAVSRGWIVDASDVFGGLHIVADGIRIEPVTRGLVAPFAVPAAARDV